jgi:FixJ family two-component response regulator
MRALVSETSTVFIVDDDGGIRKSLGWLVESIGLKVETHESAQSFLDAYTPDQAGCVILDLRMPGMGGLDLQAHLKSRGIRIPVIIVTAFGDVPSAVRAYKQGCASFIEKPFSDQDVLETIQSALQRDLVEREKAGLQKEREDRLNSLSVKERAVYDRIVMGKSNKQAAADLDLSPKTIEVHRANVMAKVGVKTLAELVRFSAEIEIDSGL